MSVAVRVLLLSWEYPPVVVGGLGRHVGALAQQLAAAGHDVVVVTRGTAAAAHEELRDGVRVLRTAADPIELDFTTETLLSWAQAAEHALLRAALPVVRDWRPDVVHAHDWLVAQCAITLSRLTGARLVTTIHATELGRHQGWLPEPMNRAIHSIERWLVHQSARVISCSAAMRSEVVRAFELPEPRAVVVPNGIDPAPWRAANGTGGPGSPLIAYAGRLVHEKGVQTLLSAIRPLRAGHPQLRLAIAGTGGYEQALRDQASRSRVMRAVHWLGFLDDTALAALFANADLVVVPSLYEPFGLVALEAAAARTPVIVSETGGLRDLVAAGVAAAAFPPGDTAALAAAIEGVLADPVAAARAVRRAGRVLARRFTWPAVAARTAAVYEDVTRPPAAP